MTTTLAHADGCPAQRIDITEHTEQGLTATHCVDCSAHEVRTSTGELIPPPTTTGPYADSTQGAAWDATLEPAGHNEPTYLTQKAWGEIERNHHDA